jgi:hypothetical protein
MPFYERQPTIYPLHRLLEEVLSGEIRIPRFQRPGTEVTWKPEQRGELLDSIYRGFPIGTVLLWSTQEQIKALDVIGGAAIPAVAGEPSRQRLVLDGHQRLSTLVTILGPGLEGYTPSTPADGEPHDEEQWVFDVAGDDDPQNTRFTKLKPGYQPGPRQIPMRIALDRKELNRWVREREDLTNQQVLRVDSLRDRLREYSVPVATLAAESLDEATETFKRINSSGTPMSHFHMVAALAYTKDFDPQVRFESVRDEVLEPLGWDTMSDMDLLRVCAGLLRQQGKRSHHPAKLHIADLAKALRHEPELIGEAGKSVGEAATLLRVEAGIHGPGILPYSWQLIVLAISLGSRTAQPAPLTDHQRKMAARWFWLTTYGGVFAGVNTTVVDRSLKALEDMMHGGDESAMEQDIVRRVEALSGFDGRAARSRACLLAMARLSDDDDLENGTAHRLLAAGTDPVGVLMPSLQNSRSTWYNRIIAGPDELKHMRQALRHLGRGDATMEDKQLLKRIGIAATRRSATSPEALLEQRRKLLCKREEQFVKKLGLQWAEVAGDANA